MFIINEHTLEHLVCCQCKKYLSVKPIKVYPNRGIKCGRCSDDKDAGVVSYFGILADQFLFPCINRFDGCRQLLKYSEVAYHEEICLPNVYECPVCIFKGSSYQIYCHFKKLHPEAFLLNNPEFTIDIDQELYNRYLYCKNNLLFFIAVQYIHAEQLLKFTTLFLGDNCDRITQSFQLYSLDREVKHTSRNKPCYSAMNGGDFEWFQVNLEEKNFDKRMVICRFNLDTEQVEGLQRLPESVKAFNGIFHFRPPMTETFSTFDPVLTPPIKALSNQLNLTSETSTRRPISKESTNQTHTVVEPLEWLSGPSAKFGHTPTVSSISTSIFSIPNKHGARGLRPVKLAPTTSTITVPSRLTCDPLNAVFCPTVFNVASTASSAIPCTTTPISSNGGFFGGKVGATALSSKNSLLTPVSPGKLGFPGRTLVKGKSKSTALQ